MGISPHLARLRAMIGHELILLPSVSVLLVDDDGRLLLVRHTGPHQDWSVPGGAVERGESPAEAGAREILEETGIRIGRPQLLAVLGGPDYEVTYANGDRVAYVPTVYRATMAGGTPAPDRDEISELGWFSEAQLPDLVLNRFARALLQATGYLTA